MGLISALASPGESGAIARQSHARQCHTGHTCPGLMTGMCLALRDPSLGWAGTECPVGLIPIQGMSHAPGCSSASLRALLVPSLRFLSLGASVATAHPAQESGSCCRAGASPARCTGSGGDRSPRTPVTVAPATPPVSAGCPEPVREDVCSHPRGVPGGAAEAHDRLGTHRLQAPGPQGAAAAQNLRCAGAGAGHAVGAWGSWPGWGGPGAALPENPVKHPQEPCCWKSDVIRGSLGTVGSGKSSGNPALP